MSFIERPLLIMKVDIGQMIAFKRRANNECFQSQLRFPVLSED